MQRIGYTGSQWDRQRRGLARYLLGKRAMFEWIVSRGSMEEAQAKRDDGHMQWLWDIADYSEACLESGGPTAESEALGERLSEPKFGYLSLADRRLIREAVILRCEAFLTVERRLPNNAAHLERELGIRILTPIHTGKRCGHGLPYGGRPGRLFVRPND